MNSDKTEASAKPDLLDPKANFRVLLRIGVLLAVLLGGVWLYLRFKVGSKEANAVVAMVTRQPIEFRNSVENVRASSRSWIPVTTPYAGTLVVELTVLKGNEISVNLVPQTELENLKGNRPLKLAVEGFAATKTKNFKRSGRVAQGAYFLVLQDTTLGLLSASSSDVKVHIRFEP